jgi:hypothetical protein
MQKNLKGLLCSLLHQLLNIEPRLLDSLARHELYKMKDHVSDWSVGDLRRVFSRNFGPRPDSKTASMHISRWLG